MVEPAMPKNHVSGITALVVDDEPFLAKAASRLLHSMGFEVLIATGGQEAIEICSARGRKIDIVLLDLFMQDMSSMETLRQMRTIDPGIKVILTSGYGRRESVDGFAGMRLDGFVEKPFGFAELERAVRTVLK